METVPNPVHATTTTAVGSFSRRSRRSCPFPSSIQIITFPKHRKTPLTGTATVIRCELSHLQWRPSRRSVAISLSLSPWLFVSHYAFGAGLLDKYVKRKKLDPLEVYVPAVILTELQIKDLEKTLEGDKPEFVTCRSLLRSGPAASLRVNIRAVAQYASDDGKGKTAFDNVDQCLRALEELDSLLLHATRNDPDASVKSMKAKIGVALNALDSLLQTVPSNVLDEGKAIADAYRVPEDEVPEVSDPELRQLESIL